MDNTNKLPIKKIARSIFTVIMAYILFFVEIGQYGEYNNLKRSAILFITFLFFELTKDKSEEKKYTFILIFTFIILILDVIMFFAK